MDQGKTIVIIGAGPTGLGAAYRLLEMGILRTNTKVVILESRTEPGGLATSVRDKQGFLWDMGGHVIFSHYDYFDRVLDEAIPLWNILKRSSHGYMKGSGKDYRFIPYPVQDNIHAMVSADRDICLVGLEEAPAIDRPSNFDQWLLKNFGEGLCNIFMRRYNRKVWSVDPTEMNVEWMGERVAVPDLTKIKEKIALVEQGQQLNQDSGWGPNQTFRYPRYGGTGSIWKAVADKLPSGWICYGHSVTKIELESKILSVKTGQGSGYSHKLPYDHLISTMPLDNLALICVSDPPLSQIAKDLISNQVFIIGIGLKGHPSTCLKSKCWMYFPEEDICFYRITVFSNYSDDHVPNGEIDKYWSIMCEMSASSDSSNNPTQNIQSCIDSLVKCGFIDPDQIISRYHQVLFRGYPVPSLHREKALQQAKVLEDHQIYSRGRFGGWRYEVGNQDHSFMQGVEVADLILLGIPEETYTCPTQINSRRNICRPTHNPQFFLVGDDCEYVIAHYRENLDWLRPVMNKCVIYHKGGTLVSEWPAKKWSQLSNVGRESHTYLTHIVQNYNCLADIVVFLQGNIADHREEGNCWEYPEDYIREARRHGRAFKKPWPYHDWGRINHWGPWLADLTNGRMRRTPHTFGEFWKEIFDTEHPPQIEVNYGGCFAVSRDKIHKHPRSFYEKALIYISDHVNPEEGHYFERLWMSIFP